MFLFNTGFTSSFYLNGELNIFKHFPWTYTFHGFVPYLHTGWGLSLIGGTRYVKHVASLADVGPVSVSAPPPPPRRNTFDSIKYVQRIYWLKSDKGLTKTLTSDHLMCSLWSKGIHLQPPGFLFYHSSPQPASLYILAYHVFQTIFNPNSTRIRKPCLILIIYEPHVWDR